MYNRPETELTFLCFRLIGAKISTIQFSLISPNLEPKNTFAIKISSTDR